MLLQIEDTEELVLVEQFRYSTARTGDAKKFVLQIIAVTFILLKTMKMEILLLEYGVTGFLKRAIY